MVAAEVEAALWGRVRPVPGRLEPVPRKSSAPYVFVDYAHTPDALEKTLQVLKPLCKGRLWVVFGCGGDRDQGKRPEMAKVAQALADCIVVTSDNPRTEQPEAIVAQIMTGFTSSQAVHQELDRERAIKYAVESAKPEDCILIAGKGHETYQEVGGQRFLFDDGMVARRALIESAGANA